MGGDGTIISKALQPCGGPSETTAVGSNARGRLYTRKKHNVEGIVVVLDGKKKERIKRNRKDGSKNEGFGREGGVKPEVGVRTVPDTFFAREREPSRKRLERKIKQSDSRETAERALNESRSGFSCPDVARDGTEKPTLRDGAKPCKPTKRRSPRCFFHPSHGRGR